MGLYRDDDRELSTIEFILEAVTFPVAVVVMCSLLVVFGEMLK